MLGKGYKRVQVTRILENKMIKLCLMMRGCRMKFIPDKSTRSGKKHLARLIDRCPFGVELHEQ